MLAHALKCDFLAWSSQWRLVGELVGVSLELLGFGIAVPGASKGLLLLLAVDNSSHHLVVEDFDLGVENTMNCEMFLSDVEFRDDLAC